MDACRDVAFWLACQVSAAELPPGGGPYAEQAKAQVGSSGQGGC